MLTREAQLKGNAIATRRLREKAINSIGKEVVEAILQYRRDGVTLREIADRLNQNGYRTMTGKEFQQAQVKRTLDRIKKNPCLLENVTDLTNTVTTVSQPVTTVSQPVTTVKGVQTLLTELDKYKQMVDSLYEENERLRQTDIEPAILKLRQNLEKALQPFKEILDSSANPNQPRLKKLAEVIEAISKVLDNK